MPKYLTITEAQQQLLNLPDELKDEPVIITKHGKPVMAALSFDQFESLMETLSVLSDHEFIHQLQESIAQAERGETIISVGRKRKLSLDFNTPQPASAEYESICNYTRKKHEINQRLQVNFSGCPKNLRDRRECPSRAIAEQNYSYY
ncbi:MAG: type II toxin-antitoxin system Phd/YefM family antitoxin [Iphinoe sp. HA4291-MV1]|jgi:prevent-host-death family protein|nr:type II toxin-antitoxin system Phd/YefM family antitoxin [Iphinoe sp. HA4291-MV1]